MPPKKKDKSKTDGKVQGSTAKKRKQALISPDNTSALPDKRPDSRISPDLSETSVMSASQGHTNYIQPLNMASMANMNSYQTQAGAFYTPPPAPPQTQHYDNSSPSFVQNMPLHNNSFSDNFQKSVLDQLSSLNKRLGKLDSIEEQLSNLT